MRMRNSTGRLWTPFAPGSGNIYEGSHLGRGVRIGIACSRFNGAITLRLLDGTLDALREAGVDRSDISIGWVPGAFELPLLALAYADGDRPVDAVITLGAVVRGETSHYEIVSGECAPGCPGRPVEYARPGRLWRVDDRDLRAGSGAFARRRDQQRT